MGVAREVDVDLIFGNDPGLPAAGAAPLDPENRAQGWLPKVHHRPVTQFAQPLGQADSRGGLSLSGGSGSNPGNYYQFGRTGVLDRVQADLGFVPSEWNQVFLVEAKSVRNDMNRVHYAPKS